MTKYAAFLRGVNVGGVNLKMAEVARALTGAGFTNVRTILASGNVLLESSGRGGAAAVRKKAEATLREGFGYDAWVLVYDLETVRAMSTPTRSIPRSTATSPTSPSSPTKPRSTNSPTQRGCRRGREDQPRRGRHLLAGAQGGTLDSTIGKTMGKPRYKSSTTTRNLRTLSKVLR